MRLIIAAVTAPPIYRTREHREIETAYAGCALMERAGLAAAHTARDMLGGGLARVLVLCGPRNNGGDGFVVARWLARWGHDVTVVFGGDVAALSADAGAAYAAFVEAGGTTLADIPADWQGSLVIDALFGIGLARTLAGNYARWVDWANASGIPILALDVPSGLDAETGSAPGTCIRATRTAAFIAWKPGLATGDGPDRCGEVVLHDLGIELDAWAAGGRLLRWPDLAADLPAVLRRARRNVHKGDFGTLAILGGAAGMVGAALIAGRAALHAGAGKVVVGFVDDAAPAVDPAAPELMLRRADTALAIATDAIVCGPGLSTASAGAAVLARALTSPVPLLLDADALTLLATDPALGAAAKARTAPTLLTPHPGEAARLAAAAVSAIQHDRVASALALASAWNAHVVLKGAGSVIAAPDGSWAINASGNPGLAAGGSGDALAGIAGALLAQRIAAPLALRLAVCLHGAAADRLVAQGAGPLGLTATELPNAVRELLNAATARGS